MGWSQFFNKYYQSLILTVWTLVYFITVCKLSYWEQQSTVDEIKETNTMVNLISGTLICQISKAYSCFSRTNINILYFLGEISWNLKPVRFWIRKSWAMSQQLFTTNCVSFKVIDNEKMPQLELAQKIYFISNYLYVSVTLFFSFIKLDMIFYN